MWVVSISILKDVPSIPLATLRSPDKDQQRISSFPLLDYKSLYAALVQLLELLPQLSSGPGTIGPILLQTIKTLIPFLEHEYMDALPYLIATSMAILPSALYKQIVDMLCYNLLPLTISKLFYNFKQ